MRKTFFFFSIIFILYLTSCSNIQQEYSFTNKTQYKLVGVVSSDYSVENFDLSLQSGETVTIKCNKFSESDVWVNAYTDNGLAPLDFRYGVSIDDTDVEIFPVRDVSVVINNYHFDSNEYYTIVNIEYSVNNLGTDDLDYLEVHFWVTYQDGNGYGKDDRLELPLRVGSNMTRSFEFNIYNDPIKVEYTGFATSNR